MRDNRARVRQFGTLSLSRSPTPAVIPQRRGGPLVTYIAYLALLARSEGAPARAARLSGAAANVHPYVRNLLPPDQRADLDACLAEARDALGEAGYARARADGRAMTLDEAVDYALHG